MVLLSRTTAQSWDMCALRHKEPHAFALLRAVQNSLRAIIKCETPPYPLEIGHGSAGGQRPHHQVSVRALGSCRAAPATTWSQGSKGAPPGHGNCRTSASRRAWGPLSKGVTRVSGQSVGGPRSRRQVVLRRVSRPSHPWAIWRTPGQAQELLALGRASHRNSYRVDRSVRPRVTQTAAFAPSGA